MSPVARGTGGPTAPPEDTPAPGAGPDRGWPPRPLAALMWVAPTLLLLTLGWRQRWVSEDAFIDFRVIEHLVAGHGPVFNLGERVEAFTNPLWVALLTLVHGSGLTLSRSVVWLGLGLTAIDLIAALAVDRRLPDSDAG